MRRIAPLLLAIFAVALSACGGGGGSAPASSAAPSAPATPAPPPTLNNVQPIAVNAGVSTAAVSNTNVVMTSVTICSPGTQTCQTIPNVQVDTGSTGLRLLASQITIALPALKTAAGAAYAECGGFADGEVWGPLATADIVLAGEKASSTTIQVIDDTHSGPTIAADCLSTGTNESNQAALGANGILGVGLFLQDCGPYCVNNAPPAVYYTCTSGSACAGSSIPLALQLANPVSLFAQDNNGVILQFGNISANGVTAITGNMIFGIGTQTNNAQSAPPIFVPTTDQTGGQFAGNFKVTSAGSTFINGFIDSGSSQYFANLGLPACPAKTSVGDLSSYYCPGSASSASLTANPITINGQNGSSATTSLSVANAQFLFQEPGALYAFNDLAGPAGSGANIPSGSFDIGAPFFFGKSIFTAFEQHATPSGTGPYFAFAAYP